MNLNVYIVLVPTIHRKTGNPIKTRYHRIYDQKILAIAGGLTIQRPVLGQWNYQNDVIKERMIPIKISCTREQLNQILKITKEYYDQLAIFCYKISDEVIIYQ